MRRLEKERVPRRWSTPGAEKQQQRPAGEIPHPDADQRPTRESGWWARARLVRAGPGGQLQRCRKPRARSPQEVEGHDCSCRPSCRGCQHAAQRWRRERNVWPPCASFSVAWTFPAESLVQGEVVRNGTWGVREQQVSRQVVSQNRRRPLSLCSSIRHVHSTDSQGCSTHCWMAY